MPVKNIVIGAVIAVLGVAVLLFASGVLKKGKDGAIEVDKKALDQATTLSAYTKADLEYTKFNYDKALALYREGLRVDPKSDRAPDAQYYVGACLYHLDDMPRAKAELEMFMARYPNHKWVGEANKKLELIGKKK